MSIKRLIKKTVFYGFKAIIGILVYFNHPLYMAIYNRLLVFAGLNMVGKPRFIAKSVRFDDFTRITVGDRLVASMNVHFLTHDYSYTTALIAIGETPDEDIGVLRNISIGDNVFIGMNTIILPGTTIGSNVIVGAGCVVRGNIPDYAIVAGNPANVIGDVREYANKVVNRKGQSLTTDKS
ncbi:acyltransferase [Imperialibacter roseus]|uniref:Acyltransferase n=1 Tax=Imperialibacter roseus TaxID=1324217 RepID=A0ABZ0ILG5_9BACT|nr:acyltransferase [Imperialibacter roseus]WOK05366.1 acyltransferase [Imperialibacter roseus]